MHIEKNICESILGTLLELEGNCKDGEKARLDMEHLLIRPDQHPVINNDEYTCNTRFIKEHKPSNHIRARIKSHVYTTE